MADLVDRRKGGFPGIQILRGVAAILVLFCHLIGAYIEYTADSPTLDNLATIGTSGVDLFFVISGFVIFYAVYGPGQRTGSIARFLWQRATRVYPLYWCALAAVLLIKGFGFLQLVDVSPMGVLRNAMLVPDSTPLVGVSWTLSYEIFFYLVFALTLIRRSAGWSLVSTTVAIVVSIVLGSLLPEGDLPNFLAYSVKLEFCFGMALAYAFQSWRRVILPGAWIGAIAVACLATVPWVIDHEPTIAPEPRAVYFGIPCLLIVAASLRLNGSSNYLRFPVLLGDASYAIYLFHPFSLLGYAFVMRHGFVPEWAFVPLGAAAGLMGIVGGLLVHRFVERPLLLAMRNHPPRFAST